jgi:hypothetical protein
MNSAFRLILGLLVVLTSSFAYAGEGDLSQPATRQSVDSTDYLTVELLTMGPGEHPFFKFGHNAIRIRDKRDRSDLVYNFGTFSFESPSLIVDFFKGRLNYWLSVQTFNSTVLHYREEQRGIISQRLNLSPEEKRSIKLALDTKALPENRLYKYDYFFDNCSTRLRDAIDTATHGQVRQSLSAKASQSLRDHALRATADYVLEYLVLAIGLGPLVDKPTDRWAEAFLPEMLTNGLRNVELKAPDGTSFPLVQSERVLLPQEDKRLPKPPAWGVAFFSAGVVTGLIIVGLSILSRKSILARVTQATLLSVSGFLIGFLGIALLSLWLFTDHAVAYRNQNMLVLSPFAILLPWYGIRVALKKRQSVQALRRLALVLIGSCGIALMLKVLPLEYQDNGYLIAFFLPCWLSIYAACTRWVLPEYTS